MKTINIILTHKCNFNCWYCYDNTNKKISTIINIELLLITLQNIHEIINEDFEINLLGGEPFLYKYIYELIELLEKTSFIKKYRITTNFSLIDFDKLVDKQKLYISVSWHPSKMNEDILFENLEKAKKNNLNILVKLVLDIKFSLELILLTYKKLIDQNYNCILHPLNNIIYNDNIKNIIIEDNKKRMKVFNNISLYENINISHKGEICENIKNQIFISVDNIVSLLCNKKLLASGINKKQIKKLFSLSNICYEEVCTCHGNKFYE